MKIWYYREIHQYVLLKIKFQKRQFEKFLLKNFLCHNNLNDIFCEFHNRDRNTISNIEKLYDKCVRNGSGNTLLNNVSGNDYLTNRNL